MKLKKLVPALLSAALVAGLLTACGNKAEVVGYLLDGSRQLRVGESMTIEVANDYGSEIKAATNQEVPANAELVWETSDESVATVEAGVVTGVSEGEVQISVGSPDGKYTGSLAVKVVAEQEAEADSSAATEGGEETPAPDATEAPDATAAPDATTELGADPTEESTSSGGNVAHTTKPTTAPTSKPTAKSTAAPTPKPTAKPASKPTAKPTEAPTQVIPVPDPTQVPAPTQAPAPTEAPVQVIPVPDPTQAPAPAAPAPTPFDSDNLVILDPDEIGHDAWLSGPGYPGGGDLLP